MRACYMCGFPMEILFIGVDVFRSIFEAIFCFCRGSISWQGIGGHLSLRFKSFVEIFMLGADYIICDCFS